MTTLPPTDPSSPEASPSATAPEDNGPIVFEDSDDIVIERRPADLDKPDDWSSTAPSGRPWHLRRATGIYAAPTDKDYDPSGLASAAAWNAAWAAVVARTSYGTDHVRPEREMGPLRPALVAAFGPYLHDLAEQHHLARNDALFEPSTPYPQRSPLEKQSRHDSLRYQGLIEKALVTTVENMVNAGLFGTVVDALAGSTPASPEPLVASDRQERDPSRIEVPAGQPVPLWDKLPRQAVGMAVLKAAFGHREELGVPELLQRQDRLISGVAATAFWDGWAQQLADFPDYMDRTQEVDLPDVLAHAITGLTRRPSLIPSTTAILQRLAQAQGITSQANSLMSWRQTGERVGTRMKNYYPRFQDATDDLFGLAPLPFWLGVRAEVLSSSKTGRWINDRVMDPVRTHPEGEEARDLVLHAWYVLDKKQLLLLEAVAPGVIKTHLPTLLNPNPLTSSHIEFVYMTPPGASAQGRWAASVFRQAGAPAVKERYDSTAFQEWVRADRQRLVNTLMAVAGKLEAEQLKKAFKDDPDVPAPRVRAPARRRL